MPAAANIDEAIEFSPQNVADISRNAGIALLTRLNTWIAAVFATGATFGGTAAGEPSRELRTVADWYGPSMLAREVVSGESDPDPLLGTTLISESAVVDVLTRTLWAVKYGVISGYFDVSLQTATVASYNTAWT